MDSQTINRVYSLAVKYAMALQEHWRLAQSVPWDDRKLDMEFSNRVREAWQASRLAHDEMVEAATSGPAAEGTNDAV